MSTFKTIQISYQGRMVKAILLGIYTSPHYVFQKTFFERLLFKKTKSNIQTILKKTYLVFVPWKHRVKELLELTEENVVSFDDTYPEEWISVPSFISIGSEELHPSLTIKDFYGYSFLFKESSFLCNQVCREDAQNLEILYRELPALLEEEFDEELL